MTKRTCGTNASAREAGVRGAGGRHAAAKESPPQFKPNWHLTPESPVAEYIRHISRGNGGAELHASYEVGIVLDGVTRRNHGAGWFDVHGGQAWIVAAFQAHWWKPVRQGYTRIVFAILPSLLERLPSVGNYDLMRPFMTAARLGPIGGDRAFARRLGALAGEIAAARPENGIVSQGRALFDLLRVLPVLAQHLLDTPSAHEVCPEPAPRRQSVYPALQLIETYPNRRIDLNAAARVCGMGRSLFASTFRTSMGVSFAQYQQRSRLALAAEEIRHTTIPLKAIAARFGFTDASHLSKRFSEHYHTTPAEYRKGHTGWGDSPADE